MRRNLLLLSVISYFSSAPTTPHLPGWGVKVKSNGPDAVKEKIMQPFFTTKPTGEGTGLGLSLTYHMVVKGHGGEYQGRVLRVKGLNSRYYCQLISKIKRIGIDVGQAINPWLRHLHYFYAKYLL